MHTSALTHQAAFWHLSVAKQYADQRREHRSCEGSLESRAGISWGIHTHAHNRSQCMEGYLRSISLCTVLYTKERQKRMSDSRLSLAYFHKIFLRKQYVLTNMQGLKIAEINPGLKFQLAWDFSTPTTPLSLSPTQPQALVLIYLEYTLSVNKGFIVTVC